MYLDSKINLSIQTISFLMDDSIEIFIALLFLNYLKICDGVIMMNVIRLSVVAPFVQ